MSGERDLRNLLTGCKLWQHLEKVKVIFLYRQDAKISVTSSCVQARDYTLYCTALILQELVMQVMHCLGQTHCCTQPPPRAEQTQQGEKTGVRHTH